MILDSNAVANDTRDGHANGNRSAIHYPSGRNVTSTFDYADRPLSAAAGATTLVSSATYLPFGPATDIVFGNGTARHTVYDTRYRATTNQLNGSGDPIVSNQYYYDAAGNITGIDDQLDPSFNRSFGYDDLSRLTAANSGEALWGQGSYDYDAMGNVRTLSLGARSANFTYDGTTPKLVSVDENNQSRDVIYDDAGNERRVGIDTGMAYTPSNHLERWKDITYAYDARGVAHDDCPTGAHGQLQCGAIECDGWQYCRGNGHAQQPGARRGCGRDAHE